VQRISFVLGVGLVIAFKINTLAAALDPRNEGRVTVGQLD